MNAIAIPPMPLSDMQTLAVAIAKSALFGIRTPEQALVLMAIAQAEGRHPVEAARDYDIINNRPAKKAEAMLRDFILAGGKVQWHSLTDEKADATFTHPQTGEVRIDWDMQRAQTAFGKKDMYAKFPRQMLRSRVVSEGVRTLWPLATSGMYEPGEVADIPAEEKHTGPTIEHSERDAINAEVPMKSAAAPTRRGPIKRGGPVIEIDEVQQYIDQYSHLHIAFDLLEEPDTARWLSNLETLLSNTTSRAEVIAIGGYHTVGTAVSKAPGSVRNRVSELLATAFGRFPEDDAPEIRGEANVMAGD